MNVINTTNPQVTVTLVEGRKSLGLALVLSFLFGPLGVLYVSALWGVLMIVLGAIVGALSFGIGPLLNWPLSMIAAATLVFVKNSRLKRQIATGA